MRSQPLRLAGKWRQLDRKRRAGLTRAVGLLLRSRIVFAILPVEQILARLQRNVADPPSRRRHTDPALISWAITTAARHVPWRSDCLVQAIAAADWLRDSGYQPRLELGLAKAADGSIRAHAWLTLDDETIVGGDGIDLAAFAPIAGLGRRPSDEMDAQS